MKGFPGGSMVKNPLANAEEGNAIHSSIHAWKIPWTQEPGRGLERVGHNLATKQQQQKSMSYNWRFSH